MKKRIMIIFILMVGILFAKPAGALISPHPKQLYDKGINIVERYKGSLTELREAEKIFFSLIDKFPNFYYGYLGLSRIKLIEACLYGDHYNMAVIHKEAVPFSAKALALGPSVREVYENHMIFEKIIAKDVEHRKQVKSHLTLFPERAETYFSVANFMRDYDEKEKALEYYKVAIQMSPDENLKVKILKRIALLYLEGYDDPQTAAGYYLQALEIKPDLAVLNEYLGITYFRMQQYKKAVQFFEKTLKIAPSETAEYYLMQAKGFLLEQEEKISQAIEFLQKATDFNFADSHLQLSLGNLYLKLAQYESAYAHFKKVIDLEPDNPSAYYSAGQSAYSLGHIDLAIDYYKHYLKIESDGQKADWIRKNIPALSHE